MYIAYTLKQIELDSLHTGKKIVIPELTQIQVTEIQGTKLGHFQNMTFDVSSAEIVQILVPCSETAH